MTKLSKKRSMFPAFLAGVAVAMLLVTGLQNGAAVATAASRLPLAARVQDILGISRGKASYLPALSKLTGAIQGHLGSLHAQMQAVFGRHGKEVRQLVSALNTGANPVALRDAIMRSVNLEGRYALPHGGRWAYGSLIDRLRVAECLQSRALHFRANKHPGRAAQYARAALLLSAQEDIQIGTMACLNLWVSSGSTPFKFSAAAIRQRRRLRSCLGITQARENRMDRIYISARARPQKYGFTLQRFFDISTQAAKLDTPIALPTAMNIVRLLKRSIAGAPNLRWRYMILRYVIGVRQQLARSGHRRVSEQIKSVLQGWAGKIQHDPEIHRRQRSALLRWIKEASL